MLKRTINHDEIFANVFLYVSYVYFRIEWFLMVLRIIYTSHLCMTVCVSLEKLKSIHFALGSTLGPSSISHFHQPLVETMATDNSLQNV